MTTLTVQDDQLTTPLCSSVNHIHTIDVNLISLLHFSRPEVVLVLLLVAMAVDPTICRGANPFTEGADPVLKPDDQVHELSAPLLLLL